MKPAESYILNQEEPFKSILVHVQFLIEKNFPEVDLRFKWKIPYYFLNDTPFFYLNSPKKKKYVDVCFWVTSPLSNYNEFLITDNRKVVKSLRYFNLSDINEKVLLSVLSEAYNKKGKGYFKKKAM